MSEYLNSQDIIKQPPPSTMEVKSNTQNTQVNTNTTEEVQRKYNRPYVGVISPASISRTPMLDTIEIKKKENPYTKYKYIPSIKIKDNFQKYISIGVFVTGLISILSLIKKK